MTQAVKVYQIAQELGMDTDAVVARIRAFGINVNNKMSKVDGGVAEQIKSSLMRERQQQEWVEVDIGGGIIKRVRRPQPVVAAAPAPQPVAVAAPEPSREHRDNRPADAPAASSTKGASAESSTAPSPAATSASASSSASTSEPAASVAAAPPTTSSSVEPSRDESVGKQPAAARAAEPPPAATEPAEQPRATPAVIEAPVPPAASATAAPKTEAREAGAPSATKPGKKSPKGAPAKAEAPVEAAPPVAAAKTETPAKVEAPAVKPAQPETPPAREETAPPPSSAAVEATPPSASAATREASAETPAAASPPASSPPATSSEPARAAEPAGDRTASPSTPPANERASVPPASPTPSMPPPKTGVATWDPITRTVTHSPSNNFGTRRVEVDRTRLQNTTATSGVRPGPNMRPGFGGGGGRPGMANRPGMGRPGLRNIGRGGPVNVSTKAMGAEKRVVKIEGQVSLQELARRMSVKSSDVLMTLLKLGKTGVNINSSLDTDTAKILASEFQYEVDDVAVDIDDALKAILPEFKDNPADHQRRAPVVTVMGHVDHGKTTLLDAILGMRVAEGEAGGITQKVSAYRVETKKGPVVFFDTPGHEAFTKLRARGAETTDVAVLVVAADDGVMPTTIEAIHHVQAADAVPIVIALNKMDKPDAKPERVLQQLMEYNVIAEEFGGETLVVKVSAKMKVGIEELVESLALQSEILDLDSNPKAPGMGTVFDATLDKGRGVVTRFLVQDGTVRTGDVVLTGTAFGKIRAMFDDRGKAIAKAGPSSPVEILGLNELPNSGDKIWVVADLKKAQQFADEHKKKGPSGPGRQMLDINTLLQANEQITVGVIIKAEAQGSVEALTEAVTKLSTDKVKVHVVHSGVGGITESDVNLAIASNKILTTVIGFNVRPQGKAQALADSEKIPVKLYTIIYEAVDDMKAMMEGQLKPTMVERALGKAEVRQVFVVTKVGTIAGSYVTEGKVVRSARARLVRDSVQVWEGKIAGLRRFKDDAKEVASGYECGIGLENYSDIKAGDVIECFELDEVASKL